MEMPKQFDNLNSKVVDDLKITLRQSSKVSIAAASFSIYAYEALKEELEAIDELRFIFTSPTFSKEKASKEKREFFIPKLNRERNLFGSEFEIKLRNQLSQRAIARECADWIRRKACFKTNVSEGVLDGIMTVANDEGKYTYMPFGEFTTTELGCERGNNMCPTKMRMPSPYADMYLANFNELWNNSESFKDVTETIIDNISTVYKENAPDFIYFVTLYNIFNEFLEDISEDVLPNEATGFKNSVIWNKLYNFQKDACLAIINKLEKFNGCILADSVGLGKTFTALSVIKYYENRNKTVLVLCPKKLNDNWITYRSNYINNPIAADRLRYDVLFHSDLSRVGGSSNGLNLDHINWGNYDLVVIDESHNFRNGGKVTTDENDENPRENRYLQLMNKVIRSGVKTKVLMLSATPVNNRFYDLKNQLALAYEGKQDNINDLLNTESSIETIFNQAQKVYNLWSNLPKEERTTQRLLDNLSFDFFELLDSVTIARSRKHIEQYYDTADIGKFPTRLAPISYRPNLTDINDAINYNEIFEELQRLNLSIYRPSNYILPSKIHKYIDDGDEKKFGGRSVSGREIGISRLMSTNLLKRLESSVNSFRLSLGRIEELISSTIAKIDAGEATVDDYDMGDLDIDDAEATVGGKKSKILLSDMDTLSWKRDLIADLEVLTLLRLMLGDITPEHDTKLQTLKEVVYNKIDHPINGRNKKVIIFTAFSDTAEYLYNCLADTILKDRGLHTAMITGDIESRSTLKIKRKMDFNALLTLFSPISKEKSVIFPDVQEEIDILIATDCISEGQNLQDCDYLINYDIHWNPVRIIQRFGRIDRIGSKNDTIQLVNFWPDMTLDEYIDLKGRVEARMKISVMTSTGDDNLLSPEEKGDLDYRREQLKRLQEEVVDIEEMNTGVSIMDLGLNEFRLDLLDYVKNKSYSEHAPYGMHAVIAATDDCPKGVVYVLKNRSNSVNIDQKNRLHPFYMVYLTDDGEVFINHLQPKELLDRVRYMCRGKVEPIAELCRSFNKETKDGYNMKHYSDLLGDAITSIISVKEQSDIDLLLSGFQGELFTKEIKGLDDFELICFLVVR
ncbi:MAG: DEAD/DEAH box helicase family protein [Alistipes sp.]|nr:DEAD/DEAH box helicase family protein [Alistipes sp.]